MERQKIFWVVLSVSVLVVVVLVAGVLLLRQRPAGAGLGTVSPLTDSGAGIYEYQREQTAPAGTTSAPADASATPRSQAGGATGAKPGDEQTMHFYIGEESAARQETSGAGSPTAATPSAGGAERAPAEQPAPKKVAAAAPRKPAPVKTTKKVTEYWIQTGSYKSQGKAEQLAERLAGKGLSGRVFSFAVKEETWYRVRVGPYTNKAEAEKFLAEVKRMQGLETSFISQVQSTRPAT